MVFWFNMSCLSPQLPRERADRFGLRLCDIDQPTKRCDVTRWADVGIQSNHIRVGQLVYLKGLDATPVRVSLLLHDHPTASMSFFIDREFI
jgi:hypothetical protein